jgi:hypothetical protein
LSDPFCPSEGFLSLDRHWDRNWLGAVIGLEALGEAEVRGDPPVAPERVGTEAGVAKHLRGCAELLGKSIVVAKYTAARRVKAVHRDAIEHLVQDDWEVWWAKRMPESASDEILGAVSRSYP